MRKFIVTISLLALTFLVSGCINQSTTKIKLNKTTFTPAELNIRFQRLKQWAF